MAASGGLGGDALRAIGGPLSTADPLALRGVALALARGAHGATESSMCAWWREVQAAKLAQGRASRGAAEPSSPRSVDAFASAAASAVPTPSQLSSRLFYSTTLRRAVDWWQSTWRRRPPAAALVASEALLIAATLLATLGSLAMLDLVSALTDTALLAAAISIAVTDCADAPPPAGPAARAIATTILRGCPWLSWSVGRAAALLVLVSMYAAAVWPRAPVPIDALAVAALPGALYAGWITCAAPVKVHVPNAAPPHSAHH